MSTPEHQQAMDLAAEAGLLLQTNRSAEAVLLYRQAADWEQKAFDQLPPSRPRTRMILGTSLASLLYKAGAYERAETVAQELLRQADLSASQQRELDQLVEAIVREVRMNGSCTNEKASERRQRRKKAHDRR